MDNIISSLWLPYNREMLLHSFLDEGMETNKGKGSCLSSHSLQLAVSRFKPASLNFLALALFKFFFFLPWTILNSLLNLLQYCFCFILWFLDHKACGIFAIWGGIDLAPPAIEVLTTGPPGSPKSLLPFFFKWLFKKVFKPSENLNK